MTKAWAYQKALQRDGTVPTIEQIRTKILSIKKERDRFFIAALYLTAGRVSEVIGMQRDHFSMAYRKGRSILIIRLKNQKSRRRQWKDIPIPLDKEHHLANVLIGYVENKEPSSLGLLGFKSRERGWQICRKHGFNPHWLRHVRLTHLVTVYDFNDQLLVRYAGWSSSKEARHYMELRWHDFLDRM